MMQYWLLMTLCQRLRIAFQTPIVLIVLVYRGLKIKLMDPNNKLFL